MDLLKLIDGLRAYRAQVEEAIAAMEELARRRGLNDRGRKRPEKRAARSRRKDVRLRPRLVKRKKARAARKGKSS